MLAINSCLIFFPSGKVAAVDNTTSQEISGGDSSDEESDEELDDEEESNAENSDEQLAGRSKLFFYFPFLPHIFLALILLVSRNFMVINVIFCVYRPKS